MICVWFGIGLGGSGVGVDVKGVCWKIDRPPIEQSEYIGPLGLLCARRWRRRLFCDVEGLQLLENRACGQRVFSID